MTAEERLGRILFMGFSYERFEGRKHTIWPRRKVFPAGFTQSFDSHDFAHLWYCLGGHYIHYVEDQVYDCGPGSIVIIPTGVQHAFEVPESGDVDLLYVDVGYEDYTELPADSYLNTIANLFLPCYASDLGHTPSLFVRLSDRSCEEFQELFSGFALISGDLNTERTQMMDNLERILSLPELAMPQSSKARAVKLIEQKLRPVMQAMRYCNEQYRQKIYLEDLLRVSTLCQTNFLKFFKQQFGISSAVYIQMLRTCHARRLLGASTFSLSYISDICGFCDVSHMVKCYNKFCRMSPKIGRKVMTEYWSRDSVRKPRISRD